MKRLIFIILFFLICAASANAATITIQQQQIPNFGLTQAPRLRIYLLQSFVTKDGVPLQAGSPSSNIWYRELICSPAGGQITIPQFTIDSTTDGLDIQTARYAAYFVRADGSRIGPYQSFENFRVPHVIASASGCTPAGTCGTWRDLREYNFTKLNLVDNTTYTKLEIEAKIAAVAENSGGGTSEPVITRTPSTFFTNETALSALATGLLKNNNGTGVPSIAVPNSDYEPPISVSSPLTRVGQNVSIQQANGSTSGFVSAADWTAFNSKENVISVNSPLSRAGNIISLNPITDALIASGANIGLNKLAALTAGRALISDGSGVISPSSVTSATLAFLDVTSSVQTQLNGKQALDADLTALAALNSTGLLARIGANSYALRTNVAASNRLSINFADGTTGDPTFDVVEANLSLNNIGGTLGFPKGGTGLSTLGTSNQLLGINNGATAYEHKSVVGTSNEISVTHTPNAITLAVPAIVDFSAKTATRPFRTGTTLPGTCSPNEDFFVDEDATPGQQLYICNSAGNGWNLIGDAGGAGTGITSINSQTGASQTLTDVDDTNVTLTINSSSDNHQFTLGWTGQLAKSRQHANTVYIDQNNTYSAGATQTVQPSANFAGLNIAPGSAPSTLNHGDVWITNDSFNYRGSGASFTATPDLRSISAGDGLIGGGDFTANRAVAVGAGVGIAVNPDDVAWNPNTFVPNVDLWNESQATRTLTAKLSGVTDPVITFSNNLINISTGNLQIGGVDVVTANGTQILNNKNLASGTSISAAPSFTDGLRVIFNPNGTDSGFNPGSHTADPSNPVNGDHYYNSTTNKHRFRENGAWVELGGGGTPGGSGTEVQHRNGSAFAGATNFNIVNGNPQLDSVAAAGSPTNGEFWYDSTQKTIIDRVEGLNIRRSGTIFVQTANVTVGNTGTETTLIGSGVGITTIPANFLVPGRVITVVVSGVVSTQLTTSTAQIRLKLGATTLQSISVPLPADNPGANEGWEATFTIVTRSTGVSGTVIVTGFARCQNEADTQSGSSTGNLTSSTITINTTGALALDLTWDWTTGNAANTVTATQLISRTEN